MSKIKIMSIISVAALAVTPSNASAFGFNVDFSGVQKSMTSFSDNFKAKTKYKMDLPSAAVILNDKDAIKLYKEIAKTAYRKKYNIIISAPSKSRAKKIEAVILNEQRNLALAKSKGNKFLMNQNLKKVSKFKIDDSKHYSIALRSKGVGAEI